MVLTDNYNRNATTNVDTARYEYNWLGEKHPLNSPDVYKRQRLYKGGEKGETGQ